MRSRPRPIGIPASSELQPAGAGSLGDLFHAAVKQKAIAVENDLRDRALLTELRDALADLARRLLVAGRLAFECGGRRGHQRAPALVRDHLGVDVPVATEHAQSGPRIGAEHGAAHARPPPSPRHRLESGCHRCYLPAAPAALPALRRICSPAYLMPLPLYGSGGRSARICAHTSPSTCLLLPSMVTIVWRSTLASMPGGS